MHDFIERDEGLYCEQVKVRDIVAQVGTPCYIYSYQTLIAHYRKLDTAFAPVDHMICYSVKANSNGALISALAQIGSGFDIVSGGELFRVQHAGVASERVLFAGVGKTEREIREALEAGILCFTVESAQELHRINTIAQSLGKKAPFALRINPDVESGTHAYITTGKKENKFGLDFPAARDLYVWAQTQPYLTALGIQMHIGSQIVQITPYEAAVKKMIPFIQELRSMGIPLTFFDLGGGFGIIYCAEVSMSADHIASHLLPLIKPLGLRIIIEPGRFIVGNAGVLVAQVQYVKTSGHKTFVIMDGGMNDLIRPALYGSYHEIKHIMPVFRETAVCDIVGPICESGDFLAKDREIILPHPGDYLACMGAGAYGFSMSSNYNSRLRPPEILVNGAHFLVIRERETYADLIRGERSI